MKKIDIKNWDLDRYLEIIVVLFLIIQPIFDLKIFYNSISTLIRTIITIILFCIYYFKSKSNKKYKFIIYAGLIVIYFIFHHLNALNFKSLVPGNFNYSVIKELLYMLKMMVPILLIYVLLKSKIKEKTINNIINTIVILMGLIIIITNIFNISYGSYSNEIIKSNLFSWFNTSNEYTYKDLASKGLFEYANQISAVLLMFLPFVIYNNVKENNIKNVIVLIINVLGLMLLGTRVAVIGTLLVFGYTIFIILGFKFKDKNEHKNINAKSFIVLVTVLVLYIAVLPKNPMFNRVFEMNNQVELVAPNNFETLDTNDGLIQNTENDSDIKYIEDNYELKKIHKQFILVSYPYKYDTDFWMDILNEDVYTRTNYRYLETKMIERVVQINNNKWDMLLGITNTRVQNIFNIEKDFVVQYYALGIIGGILVFLPYLMLLLTYLSIAIKSKLKDCNINNALSFTTILAIFVIAYSSGNLLNSLSFTIYFSIIYYKLLYNEHSDKGGENVF